MINQQHYLLKTSTIFLLFLLVQNFLYGQNVKVKVELKNGDTIYGDTLISNKDHLILERTDTTFSFLFDNIKSIEKSKNFKILNTNRRNAYAKSYLLGENALTGISGNIYYKNLMGFENIFVFNVIDQFSFEVGLSPFTYYGVEDSEGPILPYIGGKLNLPIIKDWIYIGSKASLNYINEHNYSNFYGYYYTNNYSYNLSGYLTFGNQKYNVTFGARKEFYKFNEDQVFYFWGGMARFSLRNSFVVENTYLNKTLSILNIGLRHDRNSISYSFGASILAGYDSRYYYYFKDDYNFAFPYFGITVPLKISKSDNQFLVDY